MKLHTQNRILHTEKSKIYTNWYIFMEFAPARSIAALIIIKYLKRNSWTNAKCQLLEICITEFGLLPQNTTENSNWSIQLARNRALLYTKCEKHRNIIIRCRQHILICS